MSSCEDAPHNGCKYSKRLIETLIREAKVKNFVETGTFRGFTTRDIARTFPDLNVFTVEASDEYYDKVKDSFKEFPNIQSYKGESVGFLEALELPDGPTLYYLDAHWKTSHPLREELMIIRDRSKRNEIIAIDDFYVPGRTLGYASTHLRQLYNYSWIDGILGDDWTYFYKSKQDHVATATGQIYFFHKDLRLDHMFAEENGIPYSTLP